MATVNLTLATPGPAVVTAPTVNYNSSENYTVNLTSAGGNSSNNTVTISAKSNCNVSTTTPSIGSNAFTVTRSGVGAWTLTVTHTGGKAQSSSDPFYSYTGRINGFWSDSEINGSPSRTTANAALSTVITYSRHVSGVNVTVNVSSSSNVTTVVTGNSTVPSSGYTTASKTAVNGNYVHYRITSSSSFNTTVTGSITIGTGTIGAGTISVTTVTQQTTVTAFSFGANITNAELNTGQLRAARILGFTGTLTAGITSSVGNVLTAVSNSSSTSGLSFSSANKSITAGQYLHLYVKSSNAYSTQTSGAVAVNNASAGYTVTTRALDDDPLQFSFGPDVTNATPGTYHIVQDTIEDIDQGATISISSPGETALYFGNIVGWGGFNGANKTIGNNQAVRVRLASPSFNATTGAAQTTAVTITVGSVSDTFSVTSRVGRTSPNAFNLPDQTGAALNTYFYSVAYISGNEVPVSFDASGSGAVAVSTTAGNGSGSTSSGLAYTTGAVNVSAGQYLHVRLASSASVSTPTSTTVTGGGVSSVFSITTLTADTTPSSLSFPTITGSLASAPRIQTDQILDINTASSVSGSGNGVLTAVTSTIAIPPSSNFTTATKTVTNGQYVHAKMNASATAGATVSSTITVGTLSATYSIVTQTVAGSGGGTGTGAGTVATTDYGLQITGANGTSEVLGVSNRTSNLIVQIPTLTVAGNSTSSVISCPLANNSSKVLIVASILGGLGYYQNKISITNKTSTGFTISNSYGGSLSCTVYAIRIT
tara:strand:+ start:610 stop:2910 length:2301 start_codon:yes stop_codon:yes gene_type:complete